MPLRRQPGSLRAACLTAVARHFDRLVYAAETAADMAQLLHTDSYLRFQSPFADLPSHLCDDLLEAVKSTSHVRRHHSHALLSPATRRWAAGGVGDVVDAIALLRRRCTNLQRLDVSYLRHINPNILMSLTPCFNSLVSLNLQMTLTVDQMLAKLGEMCVNLLDLNLTSTPITDRGIVMLCLDGEGAVRCQKLQCLRVGDTWVTSTGAAVALLTLPQLRDFDFERMFEALRLVRSWSGEAGERALAELGVCRARRPLPLRRALRLATVASRAEEGEAALGGPEDAARLCPLATTLTLLAPPGGLALHPLAALRHLTALSLTASPALDFARRVLPLLDGPLGRQLRNLILADFASVDVAAIGKACPHLVNFALSGVTEFEHMQQKICEDYFQELQALEIWANPDFIVPSNILHQLLLFSNHIKNLLIKGVGILTDEMMREIWKVNPMRNLSHLTLDHCHGLTKATIHRVLDDDNELCMLRIWCCFRINKDANDYVSQRIMDENMDIYFDWFPYDD